jgi:hypothetical protein
MDGVRSTQGGDKVTAAFRGFFLLVGASAIVVVAFLIVASAM